LDADEGPSDQPRYWKVKVLMPKEAQEEKAAKEAVPRRQRIIEATRTFPEGNSMSRILAKAKIKHDKKASEFFASMVKAGELLECRLEKKGGSCIGYRVAQAS
jgi:hypothetical protein